jgi:DNA-binding NarL/FixJ family response regulator
MAAMTVLVVDDHPGFRACARRLLEREGFDVVAEAGDGSSALEWARAAQPQLALVDVYLPDIDGFQLAAQLRSLAAAPMVVLISSHERSELDPLVPGCGARGFVPKDELSRQTIEELL